MNKVIVFDIDGTLANIEHRRAFVATKPKNWRAFTAGIPNDTPHQDIVDLVHLFMDSGHNIILCSGRGEESREVTEQQMDKFSVTYHQLYMRPTKDHRSDDIIKVELLQQIRNDWGNPKYWFDDRQRVVDAIRAEGVRVLQVCDGNF
jgi:phosphoglycolate phosphatase-like HAD superfamily hydrolase